MVENGILGIENRTENWKTARTLVKILNQKKENEFATEIINNTEGQKVKVAQGDVRLELFWKGFRDLVNAGDSERLKTQAIDKYNDFKGIGRTIRNYGLHVSNDNYETSASDFESRLFNNLRSTEIDIVITSNRYILIGEAKCDEDLGADSRLFLTHQLIRQYIKTDIICKIMGAEVKIIPFIVCKDIEKVKNKSQVKLMIEKFGLDPRNIFHWNDLNKYTGC